MRKKSILRLVSVAAVITILFGLAACANPSSNTPSSSSAQSSAGGSSEAKGEPTKLKVEVFDRAVQGGSDPTDNFWTDWLKEQMLERHNIEVTYVSVPRSEEIQQLNALMAGGDAPDIVFTYTQSVAYNYYKQGGLADLTDAVEQYGATLKSYLGDDVLTYGQFDGRQYIIPAKRVIRASGITFMRKDWLDAVGLAVPTNKDEFFNALVAFKEQNPGKVEKPIPYGAHADLPAAMNNILDSFIDSNMTEEQAFVLGVAANNGATTLMYPGFKDGVRYLNKMYNAGLIDPQFPLYKDSAPYNDLISQGVVGAFSMVYDGAIRTSPGLYNNMKAIVPTAEIIPVDCFQDNAGKTTKQLYLPTGIYNFVPASSKNVEGAVKYLDLLCEDDVRTFITTGEEGVNHTKDENGIPVMINLQNDRRMMNSASNLDYALIVNGVDLGNADKNLEVMSKSYEAGYEDLFKKSYDIAMKDGVVFNNLLVPFDSEAQFTTTLGDKRREILAAAITASEANFDKVYDAGIAEWLAMGGQQCIDDRQAFWNANS